MADEREDPRRASVLLAGKGSDAADPVDAFAATDFWQTCWQQAHLRKPSDASVWSRRAPHYASAAAEDDYTVRFLQKLDLAPDDSVLDMGCGNGLLALPLAKAGHWVLAGDFSEGMLASLEEGMRAAGISNIETKLMSWEDDWQACGVQENCVDVAFASRSVITQDLRGALAKLSMAARKRACAALGTGFSPKTSDGILRQIGIETLPMPDHQIAFNMLVNAGFFPEISFIASDRCMLFESKEDACHRIEHMLERARPNLREAEVRAAKGNIAAWVEEHLETNPEAGHPCAADEPATPLRILLPNDIVWAFASWKV